MQLSNPERSFDLFNTSRAFGPSVIKKLVGRVLHQTKSVRHRTHAISIACMKFDDEKVASWFGLELARMIVDACYRELVSVYDKTEKRGQEKGSSPRFAFCQSFFNPPNSSVKLFLFRYSLLYQQIGRTHR